jgi:imidazolonepropionase
MDVLRHHNGPMAVSPAANPGAAPMTALLLAMNMACTLFRMTPEEAFAGVTRNAARALGMADRGMLTPGLRADLAIWDIAHPSELAYRIGFNPLHQRIFGGHL